jgi:hypothetical protein
MTSSVWQTRLDRSPARERPAKAEIKLSLIAYFRIFFFASSKESDVKVRASNSTAVDVNSGMTV